MKMISLCPVALAAFSAGAYAAPESARSISLTQDPLVMRVNNNEFRIASGINRERRGAHGGASGCRGMIGTRVARNPEDGTPRLESKRVNNSVSPSASRTIAVDRQ